MRTPRRRRDSAEEEGDGGEEEEEEEEEEGRLDLEGGKEGGRQACWVGCSASSRGHTQKRETATETRKRGGKRRRHGTPDE